MVVTLKPELQKLVEAHVKAGLFESADALVNSAVQQVVGRDDLAPGELEKLLAVGEAQANEGRLVDGRAACDRLRARTDARRRNGA